MLNLDADIFLVADHLGQLAMRPSATSGTGDLLALVFLAFLGLCLVLERRSPFLRPSLKLLKNSYFTNFCTFLFNDVTLSLLSIPSLYFIAQQFSGKGLLSGLEDGPAKYLLSFLLLDLALYAWHYATHHVDALWAVHKVHHSDKAFNVSTGLRFHMGELILEALVRVAFIGVVGVDAEAVLVNQAVISLFVLFHHTNVSFSGERLLSMVFIVPRLHRLHHSVLREEHDSNYGAVFSIWDRLFATLKEQEPKAIGLQGVDEQGLLDLVKYGFATRIQFKRNPQLAAARKRA